MKRTYKIMPKKSEKIDLDLLTSNLDNLDLTNNDNLNFWLYCKIAIRTGLRSIDILKLRVSDIRFDSQTATVTEKKTNKRIVVPMDRAILERINKDREFVLWNDKYSSNVSLMTINRRLKKIYEGQEVNISSHSIRKTVAQHVYEKSNFNIIQAMLYLQLYRRPLKVS